MVRVFVGHDWAEAHHDVHVEDETRKRLAAVRLPEGVEGVRRFHELVAAHVQDPDEVTIATETDRGLFVGLQWDDLDRELLTISRNVTTISLGNVKHHQPVQLNVGANISPCSPDWLTRVWARARRQAGLAPHWRLHDLRHWAATTLIAAGEDIRLVAGRLGHARAATTLDVYAHFIECADGGSATPGLTER